MKNNKKKTIRNGALVCGGAIILGAAYFLGVKKGVKKGIQIGTYGLSDLIVKTKTEGLKMYKEINGEKYLIKLIKEEQ